MRIVDQRPFTFRDAVLPVALWVVLCTPIAAQGAEPVVAEEGGDTGPAVIEEMLVLADGTLDEVLGDTGSYSSLSADEIAGIGASHINEALSRIPGTWIARGSGQEHLTAIRSAVLTGPGACGEFLFLEDGIPIRPSGFCNVNNLFEVNSEQAQRIEVWRGPASAVLGGNALHGAVNVINGLPVNNSVAFEAGPYDYRRLFGQFKGAAGEQQLGLSFGITSTDGYRFSTGYDQQKLSFIHLGQVGGWEVENTISFTNLDQQTGAYVNGFEAYKDDVLRRSNPAPDAFREAQSLRLASHWRKGAWRVSPYLRWSDMDFLQHFLPGTPLEDNGQTSGGVLVNYDVLATEHIEMRLGVQVEAMSGYLEQFQEEALTSSSNFNNAVRPQGYHYDYDVDSVMAAAFYDLTWHINDRTRLVNSLRLEYLEYDYKNNMLDGNSRDDGTTCGFGGCLYNRPGDRSDSFSNPAGRLGLEYDLGTGMADGTLYASIGSGFRVPQATELYRLQRGQDVADLDSERIASFEVGYRAGWWHLAGFAEKTDNFIFRDAAGFNVSDGKTKSIGVEFEATATTGIHTFSLAGTYAEHRYDFNRDITGREKVEKNDIMDTAPRWLANARWLMQFTPKGSSELEVVFVDEHYINAANTAKYEGHTVVNLRADYALNDAWLIYGRLINVLDLEYADRGDFTEFTDEGYRYFPAMPRQLYVGISVQF